MNKINEFTEECFVLNQIIGCIEICNNCRISIYKSELDTIDFELVDKLVKSISKKYNLEMVISEDDLCIGINCGDQNNSPVAYCVTGDSYIEAKSNIEYIVKCMIERFNEVIEDKFDEKHFYEPVLFMVNPDKWNLPFGYSHSTLASATAIIIHLLNANGINFRCDDRLHIINDEETYSPTCVSFIPENYNDDLYHKFLATDLCKSLKYI